MSILLEKKEKEEVTKSLEDLLKNSFADIQLSPEPDAKLSDGPDKKEDSSDDKDDNENKFQLGDDNSSDDDNKDDTDEISKDLDNLDTSTGDDDNSSDDDSKEASDDNKKDDDGDESSEEEKSERASKKILHTKFTEFRTTLLKVDSALNSVGISGLDSSRKMVLSECKETINTIKEAVTLIMSEKFNDFSFKKLLLLYNQYKTETLFVTKLFVKLFESDKKDSKSKTKN